MKDCSNNVRTIYVNALNGNITYNSRNVPVYGQSPFVTPPEQYAIITNITEVADNTNNSFSNIVANPPKHKPKLIDSYLFDYNFEGWAEQCPYDSPLEMFDLEKIIKSTINS